MKELQKTNIEDPEIPNIFNCPFCQERFDMAKNFSQSNLENHFLEHIRKAKSESREFGESIGIIRSLKWVKSLLVQHPFIRVEYMVSGLIDREEKSIGDYSIHEL